MEDLKQFKIDRTKWRNGSYGDNMVGKGITLLLNEEGYMCCLGQCLRQMGVDGLLGHGTPAFTSKINSYFVNYGANSKLSESAVEINDNEETTSLEKELELIALFSSYGLELSFYGEYSN